MEDKITTVPSVWTLYHLYLNSMYIIYIQLKKNKNVKFSLLALKPFSFILLKFKILQKFILLYNLINIKCSEVIHFQTCCLFSDVIFNQMGHAKDENCNAISSKTTI
jgi:hypothetical protein